MVTASGVFGGNGAPLLSMCFMFMPFPLENLFQKIFALDRLSEGRLYWVAGRGKPAFARQAWRLGKPPPLGHTTFPLRLYALVRARVCDCVARTRGFVYALL